MDRPKPLAPIRVRRADWLAEGEPCAPGLNPLGTSAYWDEGVGGWLVRPPTVAWLMDLADSIGANIVLCPVGPDGTPELLVVPWPDADGEIEVVRRRSRWGRFRPQ